jgi:hypothetical protein
VLGGDGLTVPFHERRFDLDDRLTAFTDELGAEGGATRFREVVLMVSADIDFADHAAADEQRDGTVDRRTGNAAVEGAGFLEKVLGSVVALDGPRALEDRHPLPGCAQALLGDEGPEGSGLLRRFTGKRLGHADLRQF